MRDESAFDAVTSAVLWNRLGTGRRPALIVRAADAGDVARAVRFAGEHGLRIALRSGGHSWWGAPLRDDALLLDLSALDEVTVDVAARTATVGPGVVNQALAERLGPHGLAFPYGHCASVALGGYVLAGGVGWNSRVLGAACASVRALDAVTPDGAAVTASATQDSDLLWAARGAGPGFCAIATGYHLDLHALPAAITGSHVVLPLADACAVADWSQAIASQLASEVELTIFLARAADGTPICIVAAAAFAATPTDAARHLDFMRGCPGGDRALDRGLPTPTSLAALFDAGTERFAPDRRWAADSDWTAGSFADVVSMLCDRLEAAPSPHTFFLAAIAPVPAPLDAAFAPHGDVALNTYAMWESASDDAANLAWSTATARAIAPFSRGSYVGEADLATRPERAERCFTPATWQRLAEVRRRYDPGGRLHGWFA